MDQEQRRKRERDEPGIRLPEGVHRDAERCEHEVGGEILGIEQAGVPEREAAREAQHHGEQDVVDRDEDDAGCKPGERQPQCVVTDPRVFEDEDAADEPGGHRRERVVEDVERLQVPAVAHLQPLRDHLDDGDEHE